MNEILSKEEFLNLLDFLYKKARNEESNGRFGLVSEDIRQLRDSLKNNHYYQFPIDRTIFIICDLLEKNGYSYESLRNVFRSKEVSMIADISLAKLPLSFGKDMENIYFDDNFIIGIHGSLHRDYEIKGSHFSRGLLCIHGPKINRTVRIKEDGLSFYSFLQYQYYENEDVNAIIVKIPKEDINSGMWKNIDGRFYFSPKYIYGYYKSFYADGKNDNPKIIMNPNYGKDNLSYDIVDEWLPDFYLERCKH